MASSSGVTLALCSAAVVLGVYCDVVQIDATRYETQFASESRAGISELTWSIRGLPEEFQSALREVRDTWDSASSQLVYESGVLKRKFQEATHGHS